MSTDYAALLTPASPHAADSGAVNYAALLKQPTQSVASQAMPAPGSTAASASPTPPAYPSSTLDQAAQDVTKDMGTLERAVVGAGRGFTSVGRGFQQAALAAAGVFGANTQPELDALQAQDATEKRIFDAGVGKTTAGAIGEFAGETLPYFAIPAGAFGRGASLTQKTLSGAGIGAGIGATQYVDPGENRLGNTLQGAALGGIAAGAMDVAAKAGARLTNALRGRFTPIADEVTALGKQFDVPVYAPDVAQSPIMSKIGTIAEDIPMVGMAKPRLEQSAAAGEAAQALMGRLASPVDDIGRTLQRSLQGRTETLQKLAGRRYDQVAQAADPLGAVPLTNLRARATQLLDEAKKDIDPNTALIDRLERFAQAQDGNFSQSRQFRSNLGDEIRKLQTGMDLKSARPLQALKGALEQDLNQFATQAGGDVAAKWKVADQFFREKVMPQRESDLIRGMRNKNPDEVFRQFIRAGSQDRAQRLYDAMGSKGRNAVKAGILNQAWEKAAQDGAKGVTFSPAKFAQELERVQGSVGVFFKGADKKELDGFHKLMSHIERAGQVAENPPTGNRLLLPMIMGETLAPGTAATTLGSGALSRLLFTTEPGKRLLLASNRFPPGSRRLELAIDQFRKSPVITAAQQDNQL